MTADPLMRMRMRLDRFESIRARHIYRFDALDRTEILTAPWAAAGLSVLLVAMFPANVYAALEGLTLGGAPAMALLPRTLLQVVFLAATLTVLFPHLRRWTATRRVGALPRS